jgi:membrane-associated phospholipid phosphatase
VRIAGLALVVTLFGWPVFAQDAAVGDGQVTIADHTENPSAMRRLVRSFSRDIRRLPSKDNARLAINGTLLALAAHPFDDVTTLGASSSHVLKATYSGWGKALGREWVQGGAALATYVAGHTFKRPAIAAAGADLMRAQVLAATLTQGLKFAVQRTRPDREARSFPSGHASAAFATAAVVHQHFGRQAAIPAYAIAVYTSTSRLQANSHYASDVIVGATLGLIVGRTVSLDIAQARLQLTPTPIRGGVMVVASTR